MEKDFITPYGTYEIKRDSLEDKTLRGWDASDSYALDTFVSDFEALNKKDNLHITVINDSFGALTCALSKYSVDCISDSFSAHEVIKSNLGLNILANDNIDFISAVSEMENKTDVIFLKLPKSNNYLEYLLQKISINIGSGIPVIGLGMTRNIHTSTVELFEHYLGDVHTSLARKKSRLVHGVTKGIVANIEEYPAEYSVPEYKMELINNANAFSYGKIDFGTLYFLEHFPRFKNQPEKVIDLGCGDGSLALLAAEKWPESPILCVDDSYLAVESAKENFKNNGHEGRAEFKVTDCLTGVPAKSVDLILCNPPFHEYHAVSMGVAGRMFKDSFRVLKTGGSLFIVKNKHLGYQSYLEKLFGECKTIAGNKKYEIQKAVKTK
ncbi:MAG: methyltransferase [Spirochaetia bacterium]|nr:methyltransferase [Spirochaetia bacterium]